MNKVGLAIPVAITFMGVTYLEVNSDILSNNRVYTTDTLEKSGPQHTSKRKG